MQTSAEERASALSNALESVQQQLKSAESRLAGREAALQESDYQLQAAREETQAARSSKAATLVTLQASEAKIQELSVSSVLCARDAAQKGSVNYYESSHQLRQNHHQ